MNACRIAPQAAKMECLVGVTRRTVKHVADKETQSGCNRERRHANKHKGTTHEHSTKIQERRDASGAATSTGERVQETRKQREQDQGVEEGAWAGPDGRDGFFKRRWRAQSGQR